MRPGLRFATAVAFQRAGACACGAGAADLPASAPELKKGAAPRRAAMVKPRVGTPSDRTPKVREDQTAYSLKTTLARNERRGHPSSLIFGWQDEDVRRPGDETVWASHQVGSMTFDEMDEEDRREARAV